MCIAGKRQDPGTLNCLCYLICCQREVGDRISCDIFIDNGILQQHVKLDSELSNKNLNVALHS